MLIMLCVSVYLYGVYEALAEGQGDDVKSKVSHAGLRVEERLQDLFEIQLHDRAAHPGRDIAHLLQILLLRHLLPCARTHTRK